MSIPKIIHRIWVKGSGLLPEEYAEAGEMWQEMHPDWEVRTWTMPPFRLRNQELWDGAPREDRMRWRADVLRLELLLNFGGLYVDMDVIPLRPLDALLDTRRAVAGYSPDTWKGTKVITNAIMAAEPFHPWMMRCVDRLPASVEEYAGRFTAMVVGPHHVNRCLEADDDVTVLEAPLLYPRTKRERLQAFTYHMWATRNGVSMP